MLEAVIEGRLFHQQINDEWMFNEGPDELFEMLCETGWLYGFPMFCIVFTT